MNDAAHAPKSGGRHEPQALDLVALQNLGIFGGLPLCSGPMKVPAPSPSAHRSTAAPPSRRVLFVVSRDLPERYESLAYAFDGDDRVRVIFDRRRAERRQRTGMSASERRHEDRRSADGDLVLCSVGWVRIDGPA